MQKYEIDWKFLDDGRQQKRKKNMVLPQAWQTTDENFGKIHQGVLDLSSRKQTAKEKILTKP